MLTRDVESYLATRRAAGFALMRVARFLRAFAQFASDRGESHIRAATAVDWAAQATSPVQPHYRLRAVVGLARYLHAEDDRHEIPPDDVFVQRHRRPRPFIFSAGEIAALVERAARLGPPNSLRPHTYSTVFALLASTGLRVSEALKLRLSDVTPDGLLVRETKFRKNRLVPLHPTAADALGRYVERRRKVLAVDDHLFISVYGRKVSYAVVVLVFKQLMREMGVVRRVGRSPCIHALRHTFAVRSLEGCQGDGRHVTRHMLALSTYLGHASISSSYWYLDVTPELLDRVAASTENTFVGGAR